MDPTIQQQAAQQTQQQPTPQDILAANNQALIKKKRKADQEQQTTQNQAAISQALGQLNDKSTAGQIGKAIATPNYAGLCLKWVDDKQGTTNRQPTAFADFQANAQAGNISTSDKIPSGARVYFAPDTSNGNMGHVGIANSDNTFTSATDNGIKTFKISDWIKATGQQLLGWSPATKS